MSAAAPSADVSAGPPRERLPARSVRLWRATSLLVGIPLCGIVAAVALVAPGLPGSLRLLIAAAPIVLLAADLAVQPLRYRLWWYAIDEEEVTLQHGWPITTLTVVPMVRVQHVSVAHGPLARGFALADLRISTAAGAVTIPSLDREQAESIRLRIANLARIVDDL